MPTPGSHRDRRTIRFVTSNPGKFREASALLARHGLSVRQDARSLPEPQADSLEEVARAKLSSASKITGIILVEDSGLFLPALGGFPGVYSAYVYRTLGIEKVARLLDGSSRSAVFKAVVGIRDGERTWVSTGGVRGRLALRPRGRAGFGYDPLFIPRGGDKTFAEMGREAKSELSHRRRALAAAIPILRRLVREGVRGAGARRAPGSRERGSA